MQKQSSGTASNEPEPQISTQASTVYDRLQDDILTGKLEPGLKLRLKEVDANAMLAGRNSVA